MQNRWQNEHAKLWIFCKIGKWRLMLHSWQQRQLPWTRAIVFKEMTRCRCQKHRWRWPDNHNGRSKFCKYRAYVVILRLRDHDWCSMADGNGMVSCHRFLKRWHVADFKTSLEMTRQPYGLSKFCKYRRYLQILHLKDCDWCSAADDSFRRSLKRHQKHRRRWTGNPKIRSKFSNY